MNKFRTELIPYIRTWIGNSKKEKQAKYRYYNLCSKLAEFEDATRLKLHTDSFNCGVSEQFVFWLRNHPKRFLASTVAKFLSLLLTCLKHAQDEGYQVNLAIEDISIRKEATDAVYLTREELNTLNNMKLNKEASAVRDRFLLGCYTAQRYSDYSRLTKDDIVDGIIHVKQVKTGVVVKVPAAPVIYDILKRNGGEFPKLSSQQAFNTCIKRICRRAGMNSTVLIERTRGSNVEKKRYKKYQLVSSHTARRTGATLLYLTGEKVFRIMLITGHRTEAAFFLYIRIGREENAKELMSNPFFK